MFSRHHHNIMIARYCYYNIGQLFFLTWLHARTYVAHNVSNFFRLFGHSINNTAHAPRVNGTHAKVSRRAREEAWTRWSNYCSHTRSNSKRSGCTANRTFPTTVSSKIIFYRRVSARYNVVLYGFRTAAENTARFTSNAESFVFLPSTR